MINAKEELLGVLITKDEMVCAYLQYGSCLFLLKQNYTEEQLENFLNVLNFNYENGYGVQKLYGIVWLKNNNWLERFELDGFIFWERKEYPEIPKLLTTKTNQQ